MIAQLGRNFSEDSSSISGTDLISFALEQVKYIMSLSSGKTVFLECGKKQKLIDFYLANGFPFGGAWRCGVDVVASLKSKDSSRMAFMPVL